MSDRLRYLCDKDLRTHTDADLDDDVSELQELADLRFQNELMLCKQVDELKQRISELEHEQRQIEANCDYWADEGRKLRAKLEQIANYPDPDFPCEDLESELDRAWGIIYYLKSLAIIKEQGNEFRKLT